MYFFFVRPPDTIDTLLFFAANAASQAFCGTESKKNRQISVEICRFFLVEARGVEPLSENASTGTSPGADGTLHSLAYPCAVTLADLVESSFMVRATLCVRTDATKMTPLPARGPSGSDGCGN